MINRNIGRKNKGKDGFHFYYFVFFFIVCTLLGTKAYRMPYDMLTVFFDTFLDNKEFYNGTKETKNLIELEKINSNYLVLIDTDSKEILSEQRSKEQIYPASLTKIMTAVIIIENIKDLEQSITISPNIFSDLYSQNASQAGFLPNETVKAKDLLYGVLLPSGAECCITLANFISGSETDFVRKMNDKAKELGMKNTHFNNCTGLHQNNHYTTVEDIAVLLNYAIKNETFYKVFTSHRHSTVPTNLHKDGITFYNTMFQSMQDINVVNGEILGGKTGYTKEAGLCLASLSSINGRNYILVTAKADGTHDTSPFHILDAKEVYNQLGKKTNYNFMQSDKKIVQ